MSPLERTSGPRHISDLGGPQTQVETGTAQGWLSPPT